MTNFRRLDVAKSVTGSVIPPALSCGFSRKSLKFKGSPRERYRPDIWHGKCFKGGSTLNWEMDVQYATRALATSTASPRQHPSADTTLLELVQTLSEITEDEGEIVATALHMLRSGSVQLTGGFQGAPGAGFID